MARLILAVVVAFVPGGIQREAICPVGWAGHESAGVDDGEALYRLCANEGHHHHLVCRSCGKAVEIAGSLFENWVHDIASANGFTKVEHVAEFFGLCNDCSQKQAKNQANS